MRMHARSRAVSAPPSVIWKEYPADMSQQLLLAACEQAERSETAVRAAALMHIARVVARSDQTAAEQLLEQGIALAKEVDGDASSLLLCNAISLAAAVSAKHALPLYAEHRRMDPFGGPVGSLVNVMAQHGHLDDAITYLREPLPGDRFPLHLVNNLEQECHDDETRRKLLELTSASGETPLLAQQVLKNDLPGCRSRHSSGAIGTSCRAKRPHPF